MKKIKKLDKRTWLRLAIPTILIVSWLAIAGIGGPYFGKISEVASNDLSTFLPTNSEATQVNEELAKFRDSSTIPVIAVFENGGKKLSTSNKALITKTSDRLNQSNLADDEVSPPIISDDKKAAFVVVPLASGGKFEEVFPKLHTTFDTVKPALEYKITGPASFARDLQQAFSGIDVTLLLVALGVVFIILLVVYRSPLLPFLVLLTAMVALSAAIFIVWHLANNDFVELNGQVQGILFILVIGATTDYSLLYIARYKEELMNHRSAWQATWATIRASFEPIVAAGGTVIVGLLCLLLSELSSNKALGPVGGIGIALAIVSALTFLPALLALFGRRAFWPRIPHFTKTNRAGYETRHPAWAKIGSIVGRHPRRLWIGTAAVLLFASVGFLQLKADGVPQSDLVLGYSEAREGQKMLDRHFASGSGSPAYVIVKKDELTSAVKEIDSDRGVSSIEVTAVDSPSGTMPVGKAKRELQKTILQQVKEDVSGRPAVPGMPSAKQIAQGAYPFKDSSIKVRDGNVLLQVTLRNAADSQAARDTIVRLRDKVKASNPSVKIGGTTAIQYDTNQASIRDRTLLIPLILAAITIILIVLLRAIVAPIILLLTTVLSFGATLGIAAVLFNHILGFPGADPSVVLFGFVFLVALGIDYNIFLMTRVREETIKHGVRKGTIKGLVVTGGVITSAGIVLAATFAALGVIPILFLAQLAFIVAFGVLLDTIIVRSLFVPALTLEIGRHMWWPSKLGRQKQDK